MESKLKTPRSIPTWNPVAAFWLGFSAPVRAANLVLKTPRLLALTAIPLTINTLLYVAFFFFAYQSLQAWLITKLAAMTIGLSPWLVTTLMLGSKLLIWLTLALVAALSFTFVSGLICSPFNELLCRATLKTLRSTPPVHETSIPQTVWLEAKRLLLMATVGIGIAAVGLIPGLQPISLATGAILISFEYFGYPVSTKSHRIRSVLSFVAKFPFVALGLGSFLMLMMAIPFTSIVYIPLAVVTASLLWHRLTEDMPNRT